MNGAPILVATDNPTDGELVRKLLAAEFDNVTLSTLEESAVADFDRARPEVLILAFNSIEKAQRYYLGLYRLADTAHSLMHRTLLLCDKDNVQRAYELCRQDYFDDYILFWPITLDAPRLPMAVTHALRELSRLRESAAAGDLLRRARHLGEVDGVVQRQLDRGERHAEAAAHALQGTQAGIGAALDGFSASMLDGRLGDAVEVRDAQRLRQAISRLREEGVEAHLRSLDKAVRPMREWLGEMRQDVAPPLEAVRTLGELAGQVPPRVLVVDDDDFQCKLATRILEPAGYAVATATGGAEALGVLRRQPPDLILMDLVMPGMDGIETLRRLKAMPLETRIAVMMVTGQSERGVVVDSLRAGAIDFVVKPLDREVLLKKVGKILGHTPAGTDVAKH